MVPVDDKFSTDSRYSISTIGRSSSCCNIDVPIVYIRTSISYTGPNMYCVLHSVYYEKS